jgi:hypothetical protein
MSAVQQLLLSYPSSAGSGYTPAIGGATAYYDVSVSSTVHIGTGVSQWDDRSGNGHHLIQGTGADQPVYSGSGTSALITFNGTSQWLRAVFTLNQPCTLFYVVRQITWVNGHYLIDGSGGDQMNIQDFSSTPQILLFAGGGVSVTNTGLTVGSMKVVCGVFNGASSTLSVNDNTKGTGSAGTANPAGITVGAKGGGASNWSNIAVQYISLYPSALSNGDQTTEITNLRTYWGI